VRYDVNGECRVILVATRDVAKGERLYYDYNGHEHEYPTQHFV
jgi:SET domain-containing protein